MAIRHARRRLALAAVCILLGAAGLEAQEAGEAAAGAWKALGAPAFFYTPETGWGGGLFGMVFYTPPPSDSGRKPHQFQGIGYYTQKGIYSLGLKSEQYFYGDDLRVTTESKYFSFPDLYFGIGPEADLEEKYTWEELSLEAAVAWQVRRNLYLGPFYSLAFTRTTEMEEGGELESGSVEGGKKSRTSGGGLTAIWDTRDRAMFPFQGELITAKLGVFPEAFGSSSLFGKVTLDARSFHRVFQDHVIAVNGRLEVGLGEVPLPELPKIGGDRLLRGYYEGRYRDRVLLALQTEYRFPLFWRFGGVVFAAAGQVAPSLPELSLQDLKAAMGSGLRFALDPGQHVNLRFDYAVSPEGDAFYFQLGEAF